MKPGMTAERFEAITGRYPRLCVALLGDFCLDRYFDIDPARAEISIETGLPVHNITGVRLPARGRGHGAQQSGGPRSGHDPVPGASR